MNNNKKRAVILGVLFIIATVSAIIGFIMYGPILNGPDYMINGSEHANQVILGTVFELMLVCSAIGTSITLFPLIRRQNESIAIGYLFFRFFEAAVIMIGIISILALLTLSQEFVAAGTPDVASYQALGTLLLAIHDWSFLLGPNFLLGINTMMYSYLLYKTKLVPQMISVWGMIGSILIIVAGLLQMFAIILPLSIWVAILAIPVATYEMILALWLIVKGFNESAQSLLSTE